jgi:hypothetical protein
VRIAVSAASLNFGDIARCRGTVASGVAEAALVRHPRYDLADFGLDAGDLAVRFAGYVDRYDVAVESNSFTNS